MAGRRRWLVVDESRLTRQGWPTGEWQAPYGDFYAASEHRTPSESPPGRWDRPNPAWLADLPRDSGSLLDRLRAAVLPGRRRDAAYLLRHAAQALRSGELPADLVIALHRGLAGLPGVTTHESAMNLDGQPGTALAAESETRTEELIFDLDTGEFLGERITQTVAVKGIPAGTVTTSTSMSTAVVDALGALPSRSAP